MRLMPVLTLGLALALAFSMVALSGVGPELGNAPESDIDDEFEDTAEVADEDEFDPDEGGDSLLGSTVAAVSVLRNMFGVLVYTPSAIQSLGAPGWFATISGRTLQLIMALGIAQVIRGYTIQ